MIVNSIYFLLFLAAIIAFLATYKFILTPLAKRQDYEAQKRLQVEARMRDEQLRQSHLDSAARQQAEEELKETLGDPRDLP